jgi:hypothetical protein
MGSSSTTNPMNECQLTELFFAFSSVERGDSCGDLRLGFHPAAERRRPQPRSRGPSPSLASVFAGLGSPARRRARLPLARRLLLCRLQQLRLPLARRQQLRLPLARRQQLRRLLLRLPLARRVLRSVQPANQGASPAASPPAPLLPRRAAKVPSDLARVSFSVPRVCVPEIDLQLAFCSFASICGHRAR